MSVHEFSQQGFAKGTNELYNTVRPTYSAEAFARIRQKFGSDPVDVVEIASGTGLFTRALLAHPDWQSIHHLRAVEPSEGMRESFAKHTVDERVELSSGTFDNTGLASGSADMIAIAQGFRPKNVTQDMIDTIHTMFPDIPPDNIRYDLMRTGSVELSSNKILERGFLDPPPPAYYTLYPRNPTPAPRPAQAAGTSSAVRKTAPQPTLIERYNLQERVEEKETFSEADVGGKALWEDTAAKREASLKERKAQMILAARQRMLAAQQQPKDA
ncbi:CUE domain-containing protein [Mycena chlorophos]|uniref:CUE domain-containing protein n=1 Tax=Mycena chlorophos TaxID=658473 RepID=A0A8H6WCN5_MYCCL|nr:CUE domain-containing protein [Mycena chlorophos]